MRSKRAVVVALTAVVLAAGTAVVAFACVPQPRLVVVAPRSSGPAGTSVSVEGIGFDPPPSSAEIRWNTSDGAKLGSSDQADFSVPVTIPNVAPGLYGILVMSRGADGVLGNTGRATFQVTDEPPLVNAPPATPSPPATFAAAPVASSDSGPSPALLAFMAVGLVLGGVFIGRRLGGRSAAPNGTDDQHRPSGPGPTPDVGSEA